MSARRSSGRTVASPPEQPLGWVFRKVREWCVLEWRISWTRFRPLPIPASCCLPCYCSIAVLMQDCAGSRLVPTLIASMRRRLAIRLRVMSAPQVIVNPESSACTHCQVCSWLAWLCWVVEVFLLRRASGSAGSVRIGHGRVQFDVGQLAQVDERRGWGRYSQREHARSLSPHRYILAEKTPLGPKRPAHGAPVEFGLVEDGGPWGRHPSTHMNKKAAISQDV